MSATPEQTRATVDDLTHPEWCELATCEPGRLSSKPVEGTHHSRGTMWPSRADAAEVKVGLVHGDDFNPRTGLDEGSTHVEVEVLLTEICRDDGTPIVATTWLTATDARMLAEALARYAFLAEQDSRVRYRGPASENRNRR